MKTCKWIVGVLGATTLGATAALSLAIQNLNKAIDQATRSAFNLPS